MAEFGKGDKVLKFGQDDPVEVGGQVIAESLESVGRRALDAFTLGFGDEIIAGVQSAFGDTPYGEALEQSEARTQEFQRQAQEQSALPFNLDPVDIAGLATGGGALFGGARMLPGVRSLPNIARNIGGGAVVGGTAAAGQPGTLEERVSRVPGGAAIGAAVAPVAGAAANIVGRGVGAARDLATRYLPGAQDQRAIEGIARTMERSNLTPQAAEQAMQRGGPEMVLADIDPNLRRRGQHAVELEGEGRSRVQDMLTDRGLEQGPRVSGALRDAMEEGRDFHTVMDDLDRARRANAAPLYREVHSQTIQPTDRMRAMIGRDSFRKAYAKARALATEDGVTLPSYQQLSRGDADLTGFQTWDYIKRGMDEYVAGLRTTQGMGPGMRRAANQTRRDLLEDLDALYPPYADARAAWAGPSRSRELMEEGREVFDRRDPEEWIAFYSDLTPGEQDYVKLGVVQEVTNRIGNIAENRDAASAFWTKPNNQRKLAVMFPRQENLTTFMDRMVGEREMAQTAREVLGQSRTAERQALSDQYAIENAPGLVQLARQVMRGDVGGIMENQARRMAQQNRIPLAQREAEARILFEQDPAVRAEYLRRIGRSGAASRVLGPTVGAAASGGAAAGAGRNENTRRLAEFLLGGP